MIARLVHLTVLLFLFVVTIGSILDDSVYATTIRLQFSGHLTTAGSCQQLSDTHIQCQVPARTEGRLQLQATVNPSTRQVSITSVSVPSWASFSPTTATGTATTTCTFTPPTGSAGQTFQLIFRANVPSTTLAGNLTVTLDVTRTGPPEPVSYGPYGGVTDGSGRFTILIPWMDDTYIVGCLIATDLVIPGRGLAYTSLSVTLVPKWIGGSISSAQDIGSVTVSSSGYGDITVDDLSYASSMDLWGKTMGTVQLGYFCLKPTGVEPGTMITGVTDANGDFSLSLTSLQTTVEGRLTECTVRPLPNQAFSLTLVPKSYAIASATDIAGFTFSVGGYLPTTITQFSRFSIFGLTSYLLGDISLTAVSTERDVAVLATVFDVPFVAPGTSDPIDGVIGADWQDGLRSEIQLGDYPAVLHAQHDGANVFLAIELFDAQAQLQTYDEHGDLIAIFLFDNGDGQLFSVGDDQIRVPVSGTLLHDGIDYVGDLYGEAVLDAQQDAVGCGTRSVDGEGVRYTVEISRPIDSGDEFDVSVIPCMEIPFSLGFATTTVCGKKTETVSRSTIHLIPQPTAP